MRKLKILIVSESIPFPPDSGKELPIAEIFSIISKTHLVDLLVCSNDTSAYNRKLEFVPASINQTFILNHGVKSKLNRFKDEIVGKRPSFIGKVFKRQDIEQLFGNKKYDYLWISPVSNLSFVYACQRLNLELFEHIAIGLNDVKTGMYEDAYEEMKGFGEINAKLLFRWLRTPFVKRMERKYLRQSSLVHVQTENEKRKIQSIFRHSKGQPMIVAAPNGIKRELLKCTYQGESTVDILYMTHLNRGRKKESKWFIQKVWPIVEKVLPNVKLILVGRPKDKGDVIPYIDNNPRIIANGFADNLGDVFSNVRLSVVPIFHGTGLINRILDSIVAGVPVVSTINAIKTIDGLIPEQDIAAAQNPIDFAEAIINLYNDPKKRDQYSKNARKKAQEMPDWEKTSSKILSRMQEHC